MQSRLSLIFYYFPLIVSSQSTPLCSRQLVQEEPVNWSICNILKNCRDKRACLIMWTLEVASLGEGMCKSPNGIDTFYSTATVRHSKCHNTGNQRLCNIFRASVKFVLKTYAVLSYIQLLSLFLVKLELIVNNRLDLKNGEWGVYFSFTVPSIDLP